MAGDIDFSYSGANAAAYWYKLKNSSEICLTGKKQSPINISPDEFKRHANPPEDIKVAKAYDVDIEYDGHTIEILNGENELPASFKLDGKSYELHQFHFHTPSENLVDGKYFDMEAHFVFKTDRTPNASLSVVSVLYNIGSENQFLIPIVSNIPTVVKEVKKIKELDLPRVFYDIEFISKAYRYSGSLTTPPCSEGVEWWVNTPIQSLNLTQFNALRDVMGFNSRYAQIRY
ncbi:1404_t:CDS:2 [Entrophospora sp. SA101]|nr:2515_t:CDS:2 [Entrophospora sp. SA101]CAJ0745213.1 13212_t:CDS:2 [Entrophospora sp. SA101]CAJ0748560.1 1404_t:CDS:2 [Entrophospora sp. SA101]CAJ0823162.1 1942_t:CDS:2 [Entrophospora sp. SA101]CAJ0828701.1 2445_t:CDS:2 [Entrophospora sp. SA101]